MGDHNVPGLLSDHAQSVEHMPVNAGPASGFNGDVIVQPHLLRERLEQGRHTTLAFTVQIAHRVCTVITNC